jgi:hypothetical protein
MFDLEQSITDWRRQMLAAGIKTPVPLEELEIHLREEIEQRMKTGLSAQAAFNLAAERIGHGNQLNDEFVKAGGMNKMKRRKLAGCFYAAILGVYMLAATCAMFKNDLSAGEWLSGLAAQAALLLGSGLIWWSGPRFFPLIGSRRIQSAAGLLGGISGAIWFVVFANCILPRFDFTTGQLMVAVLWAMVPTLVLPTMAFLLLEKSENRPATAVGI